MSVQYYEGVGRRKESTARVRLMSGSGKFVVNEKEAQDYFTRLGDLQAILAPLAAAGQNPKTYDITVTVEGGGVTGQTSAVQLGMARALVKQNADWNSTMRKGGFLTR
ncbi:MAG: 30S ribosomal protein S9, partial [Chloroflexota bacterium]